MNTYLTFLYSEFAEQTSRPPDGHWYFLKITGLHDIQKLFLDDEVKDDHAQFF